MIFSPKSKKRRTNQKEPETKEFERERMETKSHHEGEDNTIVALVCDLGDIDDGGSGFGLSVVFLVAI